MKKTTFGRIALIAFFAVILNIFLESSSPRPTASMPDQDTAAATDTVLFMENFASADLGKMPSSLKTNGGGKVLVIDGAAGKWLAMQAQSMYKTTRPINLPEHFTVSFDLFAVADDITDLSPVTFGFAVNNSATSYIMDPYNNGGLCTVQLQYYNKHVLNISSSATKVYANNDFDLTGYTNRSMHVEMKADGDELSVSLDGTQVYDTRVFQNNRGKYFFISAPFQPKNKAFLALGNLQIRAPK